MTTSTFRLSACGSEWILTRTGELAAMGRFSNKQEAMREGLRIVNQEGASLVLGPALRPEPPAQTEETIEAENTILDTNWPSPLLCLVETPESRAFSWGFPHRSRRRSGIHAYGPESPSPHVPDQD